MIGGVKILVDGRFARQARELSLRFQCGDCFHYVPETGGCAHFWPNDEHKAPPPEGDEQSDLLFCKEFELR